MSLAGILGELGPVERTSAEQWEAQQAQAAGLSLAQLRRRYTVEPCPCSRVGCDGWRLSERPPATVTIVMDRTKYPDRSDALAAIWGHRPRLVLISIRAMKLRDGRLISPQGRRDSHGAVDIPVWTAEVRKLAPERTSALRSATAEAGHGSTT